MQTHAIHSTSQKAERLFELDALRGLAALSVVVFHFTINANKEKLGWDFRYGVTGVDIFFMISGFVIFQSIRNARKWQDFVVKRFARLYPAFWYCMLITALVAVLVEPQQIDAPRILANSTMVPAYFGIEYLDGSYWTLLVELIFYLWILALLITKRVNYIEQIGALSVFLIIAFHMMSPLYSNFYHFVTLKVQLINHFPLFFSGILFYLLKNGGNLYRIGLLLLFCLFSAFYLHDKGGPTQYHLSFAEHCIAITLFHFVFVLFVAGKLGFLVTKPLLFLGNISYCLYLIHQYVGLQMIEKLTTGLGVNIYFAIIFTIAVCVSIATIITRYIEIPCYRLVRDWYSSSEQSVFHQHDNDLAIH